VVLKADGSRAVPALAAAHMERWALVLSAYDYDLMYRGSEEHSNADGLSKLPCQESRVAIEGEVYTVGALGEVRGAFKCIVGQRSIQMLMACRDCRARNLKLLWRVRRCWRCS